MVHIKKKILKTKKKERKKQWGMWKEGYVEIEEHLCGFKLSRHVRYGKAERTLSICRALGHPGCRLITLRVHLGWQL